MRSSGGSPTLLRYRIATCRGTGFTAEALALLQRHWLYYRGTGFTTEALALLQRHWVYYRGMQRHWLYCTAVYDIVCMMM